MTIFRTVSLLEKQSKSVFFSVSVHKELVIKGYRYQEKNGRTGKIQISHFFSVMGGIKL